MAPEKIEVAHGEQVQHLSAEDILANMDPAERAAMEKRLVRKLDMRLMPVLVVMIVLKYGYCSD